MLLWHNWNLFVFIMQEFSFFDGSNILTCGCTRYRLIYWACGRHLAIFSETPQKLSNIHSLHRNYFHGFLNYAIPRHYSFSGNYLTRNPFANWVSISKKPDFNCCLILSSALLRQEWDDPIFTCRACEVRQERKG